MSNVIQFPSGQQRPTGDAEHGQPYSVEIVPNGKGGFEFDIYSEHPICEDCVASDLAAIALSLRPPPRSFLQRLKALFLGDDK